MPGSIFLMRLLMILTVLSMATLAAFFLRRRCLPLGEYLAWGLLAVMFPLIGPFLVILLAPGVTRDLVN